MTRFRPCIDLHCGHVKQIVGASLTESSVLTNYVSAYPAGYYAALYQTHQLTGAHVIKLGPGNDQAATEALAAWPKALQIGGGITIRNAQQWLDNGAEKVIVTSWLFPDTRFDIDRLRRLTEHIGRQQLVIDLSCKTQGNEWVVAMDKWQTNTDMNLCQGFYETHKDVIVELEEFGSEFLVHAADVEGLCNGIDEKLVASTICNLELGEWVNVPCTYAGGGQDISDLDLCDRLSNGKVDLTFGSALDIFGGSKVKFEDAVAYNSR